MLQLRPGRIAEEEHAQLALPPIPLEVAVQGLRAADQALDVALDKVWETSEEQLADTIEGALKSTMESLHEMLRSTEDEEGRRALARNYLNAAAEMEEVDVEGLEMGLPRLSEAELTEGISATRAFLQDVGDTLLSVQRDEIEEVSDVILSASRVGLQLLQRVTHRALKTLQPKGAEGQEEEEDTAAGGTGAAVVEEASEEEIAEFYRKRGLDPPAPSAAPAAPTKKEEKQPAAQPADLGSSKPGASRRRFNRPRILWRPLAPQVRMLPQKTLEELRDHPFKTAGVMACVAPFSGLVIFCLPGVLFTDHFVLQKLYGRYGAVVEEAVDDVVQVGRLGFVVSRLALRQSYRVARRQLRKVQAEPTQAISDAGAWAWDAATHPFATATAAYGLGKQAAASALDFAGFLRAQLRA